MKRDNKKPLVEWYPVKGLNSKLIKESRTAGEPVIVPALLQRSDIKNANGRIYPHSILEREAQAYQQLINNNSALGELDHPATEPVVRLAHAAIAIKEIHWEGNELKGQIEVLYSVPSGNVLVGLMEHGITVGISSRGVGSTYQQESDGEMTEVVDDDFQLICFDAVSIGSVEGAGFLREHKLNINEGFSLDKFMKMDSAHKAKYADRHGMKSILEVILQNKDKE